MLLFSFLSLVFLCFDELLFALTAFRTHPILRQLFKEGFRWDLGCFVTQSRIIFIAAAAADVSRTDRFRLRWLWTLHLDHRRCRFFWFCSQGLREQRKNLHEIADNTVIDVYKRQGLASIRTRHIRSSSTFLVVSAARRVA